jgi:Na+/melibiose symporter-like transporter
MSGAEPAESHVNTSTFSKWSRHILQDEPFLRAYGLAHLGKSLTWYFSELLFAYFLTEVCGLSPHSMGQVLAASLVFSATIDVSIGKLLSHRICSAQRACAFQFPGAVASGLALAAFSGSALVAADIRFAYALGSSCLFRLAYAFYDVPQNAILGLARGDAVTRTQLSATRLMFSGVASVVVAVAASLLIGAETNAGKYPFVIFSVLLALVGGASAFGLRLSARTYQRCEVNDHPQTPGPGQCEGGHTGQLFTILTLLFVVAGATGVFSRLEPYFAAKALPDHVVRTAVLACIAIGGAVAQPFWMWTLRGRNLAVSFRASAVMLATGSVIFSCAGPNTVTIALAGMIYGGGVGGLNLLLWSAMANLTASGPGNRSPTNPALAFGLVTCCAKLASATSVIYVSQLLHSVDYRSSLVASSWMLLAPMTAAPLTGALICFVAAKKLRGVQPFTLSSRPRAHTRPATAPRPIAGAVAPVPGAATAAPP